MGKRRTGRIVGLLCLFVLAASCSDDEEHKSLRGESCERHSDCGDGLACVGQVCTEKSFGVQRKPNQCVLVECEETDDCCEESPACAELREDCDSGLTSACDQAERLCACNQECVDFRCRPICSDDNDCGTGHCQDGECVQCQCDAHCGAGELCRDAVCVTECTRDADCPRFHACEDDRCVEVGCAEDRECIAHLGNVLAFCDDEGKACRVRCSSDIECGSAENFGFSACVDGACRDLGCETDEECRAHLKLLGDGRDAKCEAPREPTEPGVEGVGGEECPTPPCADTCAYALNGACNEPSLCEEGTDCTDCSCGNGVIDDSEECDGVALGGATCQSVTGIAGGTLRCRTDCSYDTSSCSGGGFCGNGIVDIGEECDTFDLNGLTCSTATGGVFPLGSLDCSSSCTLDTSGCNDGSGFCGDGVIDIGEECDSSNFNGETCSTATSGLYPSGSLSCDSFCALDTSACTSGAVCGNSLVEGSEECDTSNLDGQTCSTATGGLYPSGSLSCDSFCSFDTSACTSGAVCGNSLVEGSEECDTSNFDGETCSTATSGLYPDGNLQCSSCSLDTTGCSDCGNGTIEGAEECDGTEFGTETCSTATSGALPAGDLQCSSCLIDISNCTTNG